MRLNIALVLLLSVTLLSCTTPKTVGRDLLHEQVVVDGSIPDGWFVKTGIASQVDGNWIGTFEDERLVALVDEALEHNHDLAIAANAVQAVAGLATIAGAALKPVIALGGGALTGEVLGLNGDLEVIGGGISWELDLWGRVASATRAAKSDYQASEADLLYAREAMAGLVARLWFQTGEAVLLQRTAAETVEISTRLLTLTELRQSKGAANDQEVHLARAALEGSRESLLAAEIAVRELRRALEIILGRYPAAEIEIMEDLPEISVPIPAGLPSEILERRYDVLAAEYRVAAAFSRLDQARAARLPRIGLTAFGGRSSNELVNYINQPSFWGAGVGFLAPVYLGGALQAQVGIRTVQQQSALTTYGSVALKAFNEVETALDREASLVNRHTAVKLRLTSQRKATQIELIRYKAGTSDMLRVDKLQKLENIARLSEIHIRRLRLTNRVDLYLALGGGAFTEQQPEHAGY